MATDWAADVKKYDAKADDAAIAGIVRYCGIALRNRDSALVSFSDKAEIDRVRNNYLKKKLGLTQTDAALDAAIAKVGEKMKADRTKNRVTVYYLLASEFKALGQFVKAAPAAKKAPAAKAPAAKSTPAKAAPAKTATLKAPAKSAAAKSKPAAKAAGAAAVVAGAAIKAKPVKAAPAKKAPAAKTAAAPAKKAAATAPAKKAAAPAKKAAAPAKATTAKAAAPAANATQGLLDKAATTASDAAKAAPKAAAAVAAGTAAAVGAAATKAADTASAAADKASAMMAGGTKPAATAAADDGSEINWLWWVIGLAVVAFVAWYWVSSRNPDIEETNATEAAASAAASEVGTDLAAAVPEGNAAIPAGAGVTSEMRDGKPVVKVYFDSGMTAVTPEFAATAGGLKSWLDTHSGTSLAVSGYSDPSGNAAANAELAKQRAQAVQSALVTAGIPATSAALVKPDVVADATVAKEAARRVEVVVK